MWTKTDTEIKNKDSTFIIKGNMRGKELTSPESIALRIDDINLHDYYAHQ